MKLVEDFDRIKKRWSVKIIKLGAAASAGWLAVQGLGLAGSVPQWVPAAVTGVVFVAALVASYTAQANLPQPTKDSQ